MTEPTPFIDGYRLIDGTPLNNALANPSWSVYPAFSATPGGTVLNSKLVVETVTVITVAATPNAGIALPQALPGRVLMVINQSPNVVTVFAQGNSVIEGSGGSVPGNIGISLPVDGACYFIAVQPLQWFKLDFLPVGFPNSFIETQTNIAALRLWSNSAGASPAIMALVYNTVPNDGGGLFWLDASDNTTPDNGTTVIVDAVGNRWKRELVQGVYLQNTPAGTIAATTVQGAINELNSDFTTFVSDLASQAGAGLVGNTPAGTIASTTVQGAINEIVSDLASTAGASLVGSTASGLITATTVQGAINQIGSALSVVYPGRGTAFYVDSIAGSNSNSGLSPATAVQTIAYALSLAATVAKPEFYLKLGSTFREQFIVPDFAYVGVYGESGNAPVISGADVLANGSFTLTPAQTYTYQISLPSIATTTNPFAGVTNADVLMVWEDNVRLGLTFNQSGYTRPTSIADVEATDGSFWWDSTNKILYVHPTSNGNPITNGKAYEASVRTMAIGGGDGVLVENIVAEKAGAKTTSGQQGYAILGYKSGQYRNCIGRYGWNHLIGVANDQTADALIFEYCNAYDAERQTTSAPTLFIAFKSNCAQSRVVIKDCVAQQPTPWSGSLAFSEVGFYYHGSSILCEFQGNNTAINCRYGIQFLKDAGATQTLVVINGSFVFFNCNTGLYVAQTADSNLSFIIYADTCSYAAQIYKSCSVRGKTIDCVRGLSANFGTALVPISITVRGMMFMSKTAAVLPADSQGLLTTSQYETFDVKDTLFHNLGVGLQGNMSNPVSYSDYNSFSNCVRIASETNFPPGFFTTLAAWTTASGYDANSNSTTQTIPFSDYRFPVTIRPDISWPT